LLDRVMTSSGMGRARAAVLLGRYGSKALALSQRLAAHGDLPLQYAPDYSLSEIGYLCLETGVVHLSDLFIRRTLLALNVIQQVLIEAIGGGVRRIDAIRIEDEQLGRCGAAGFTRELRVAFDVVGGERAIRALVAGVVDTPARGEAPFLAVDEARMRPVKGEVGMLELDLTVVALQIEKGDDEELP
jgi:hypothetical protein